MSAAVLAAALVCHHPAGAGLQAVVLCCAHDRPCLAKVVPHQHPHLHADCLLCAMVQISCSAVPSHQLCVRDAA